MPVSFRADEADTTTIVDTVTTAIEQADAAQADVDDPQRLEEIIADKGNHSNRILVHFEIELPDLPRRYRLLRIESPDDASAERIVIDDLPVDWIENLEATRAVGDAWIARARSLLLVVPSAIVPATHNVLINPGHADAGHVRIAGTSEHVIDRRLIKGFGHVALAISHLPRRHSASRRLIDGRQSSRLTARH